MTKKDSSSQIEQEDHNLPSFQASHREREASPPLLKQSKIEEELVEVGEEEEELQRRPSTKQQPMRQ